MGRMAQRPHGTFRISLALAVINVEEILNFSLLFSRNCGLMVINIMKKLILPLVVLTSFNFVAHSAPVFSENFDTYINGNLVGQGGWLQLGSSAVNPIQVSAGTVSLANNGQDVNKAFDTPLTPTDGSSIYYGLTLNITAAQLTGDTFTLLTPATGSTSFFSKLYAQSSGTGYVLGYATSPGAAVTYGSTVLDFSTPINVVVSYDSVVGTLNDTGKVYVNPTSSTESQNTVYVTGTYSGTTAEPTTLNSFNLRQGSITAAPTITGLDNIAVSSVFSDVAQVTAVPEPSTYALLGMGGLALLLRRRSSK